LQVSKELLLDCIGELKAISYINSTPNFSEIGFTNAIEILMQLQFKKQAIVHALDVAIDEVLISNHNRINIYRLLQLWLGYIVTKQSLISVLVAIKDDDNNLLLQITDEVSKAAADNTNYTSPHLLSIKERLNVIGATMQLQSSDEGRCFTITFLIKKQSN